MNKVLLTGIVAGIGMLIAGMAFSFLTSTLFPQLTNEYEQTGIFRPWTDPLMSLFFLHPFMLGIILSLVWERTKKIINGKTSQDRAMKFAFWYFLVATASGMLITYSSFQVSLLMIATWTISGLIEAIVAGFIFAKMNP